MTLLIFLIVLKENLNNILIKLQTKTNSITFQDFIKAIEFKVNNQNYFNQTIFFQKDSNN